MCFKGASFKILISFDAFLCTFASSLNLDELLFVMLDIRGPGAMVSVMEMEKTVIFLLQGKAMELAQRGILYPNLDSVRTE